VKFHLYNMQLGSCWSPEGFGQLP